MVKRYRWVFLVMAGVVAMVWWSSSRVPPKPDGAGAVSNRETPAARNSDLPGGERDREVVRESSRHSRGEIERHQAEERRLSELKRAVREQEDKVKERMEALAAIVKAKGIIGNGPDAGDSGNAVTREDAIKKGLDAQDFVDAKREVEIDLKLLEAMKLNLANERAKSQPGGK